MIFAPLLILTGIDGFLMPAQYGLMSNATPYNLFHIIFGAIAFTMRALTIADHKLPRFTGSSVNHHASQALEAT